MYEIAPDQTTCCIGRTGCINNGVPSGDINYFTGCDISNKMILINDNDIEQGDDPLSNCCEPIVNECKRCGKSRLLIYDRVNRSGTNEKMCDENYEILQPCYQITDETICNSKQHMMEQIDASTVTAIVIQWELNTRDNCCIQKKRILY